MIARPQLKNYSCSICDFGKCSKFHGNGRMMVFWGVVIVNCMGLRPKTKLVKVMDIKDAIFGLYIYSYAHWKRQLIAFIENEWIENASFNIYDAHQNRFAEWAFHFSKAASKTQHSLPAQHNHFNYFRLVCLFKIWSIKICCATWVNREGQRVCILLDESVS